MSNFYKLKNKCNREIELKNDDQWINLLEKTHGNNLHLRPLSPLRNKKPSPKKTSKPSPKKTSKPSPKKTSKPSPKKRPKTRSQTKKK